jgi:hypothetical protein
LDDDGTFDEIAFQIELKPHQTRIVTIAYGDPATIARLRSDYPKRTHAKFTQRFEGMGWESDVTAWRIYFDKRNAIDLYGKRRPGLYLEMFGTPEYDYHEESPFGRDIYKIGDAIGIGSVAALVDGKVVKVANVDERSWRIIADGPVRSIVELKYKGWAVGGRKVNLTSRITQWAGKHGFEHRITVEGAEGLTLVTGLPRKSGLDEKVFEPTADAPALWRATWGHQVLKTGATATENLPDQNLGLAIIAPGRESKVIADDSLNLLVQPAFVNGTASWDVLAGWDQEGSEALTVSATSAATKSRNGSYVPPANTIFTRESFTELVQQTSRRITQPAQVSILSESAAPQSAPPDTLHPARSKSYAEALELMRQAAERTAQKWESVISEMPP